MQQNIEIIIYIYIIMYIYILYGWRFQTCFIFHNIYGIILPIEIIEICLTMGVDLMTYLRLFNQQWRYI